MSDALARLWDVDDDPIAFFEFAYERGWTDGLPVIPPTPERVDQMLAAIPHPRDTAVATLDPRHVEATLEKIAINAVMAGCTPEYLPTVIAGVRALGVPEFNLQAIQTTTNPVAPLAIVNGPERLRIGMNAGRNTMGQGTRANATIGRALRLIMINIGGGIPGITDKAIHGMPAKFSFCMAENEEDSPWEPLHVERKFAPADSTVTMVGACSLVNCCLNLRSERLSPKINLELVADAVAQKASNNVHAGAGNPLVVFPTRFAWLLHEAGWDKADIKQYLWERGSVSEEEHPPESRTSVLDPHIENGRIYPCRRADDIMVLVAGGPEPYHVMYLPNFGLTVAASAVIERSQSLRTDSRSRG